MPVKGKVLLMDDEQIIRDVTHEILQFLNYEVMSAREGIEAVDLYKKEKMAGHPFDMVILDLSISNGLGGKETIDLLRNFDPAVKAVISSGFTDDPVVKDFSHYGFSERLTKPYNIHEMKNLLEKVIKK
jgi:CheY-like chemotaxis protein